MLKEYQARKKNSLDSCVGVKKHLRWMNNVWSNSFRKNLKKDEN